MNISYVENHSMDKFHDDEDIQILVEICLKNYDTFIFDDIIGSITFKNKNLLRDFLNEAKNKYISSVELELFDKYQNCLLNLFDNPRIKNLKGAFLEVLSFKIFELAFNPFKTAKDCNVLIDDFKSKLTVDIAMEYAGSGLICECKVPISKFNGDIFENLLEIKTNSLSYFHPYAVTLESQERMDAKKIRIETAVDEVCNLDEIIFVCREDMGNFNLQYQ